MKPIVTIGDIHGLDYWKEIVDRHGACRFDFQIAETASCILMENFGLFQYAFQEGEYFVYSCRDCA